MEQRIGNQNVPHFDTQSPLPDFLIPTLLQENRGRNPVPRYYSPATAPRSPFYPPRSVPDQTLEDALLALNLSSDYNPEPPVLSPYHYGDIGGVNSLIGGDSVLPFSFHGREQGDVSLRSRNSRMMDSGMGPRYPTVGSESWDRLLTLPNPTAVINNQRYIDGCLTCLQSKKELSTHFNAHFPMIPCSNSNRNFDSKSSLYNPQQLNHLSLKDFGGSIACLAKEQNGCRILQNKFENPNEDEIEMVLSEVINDVDDLMKNQFGNYLIQKLISVCNEDQRTRIIRSVTMVPFQLICICLDQSGTRTIQKLLEYVTTPQQVALVMQALSPGAVTLATDVHGHHVIQYCLLNFSNEDNKLILNPIADNCFAVAKDRSGCCVLQSCLDHCQGESRKRLVTEIIASAIHLAEDPYGNYVLQHMLGKKIPEVTADLLRQLEGNFLTLSCNKYASNVVEKCLTESGEDQSARIIMELLQSLNVSMLLLDPFGNFVIQSALSVSKGPLRNALLNLVQANAPSLRNNLYGKKLLAKFDKRRLQ